MNGQFQQEKNSKETKTVSIVLIIFSTMIISLCFQDTINYDEYFSLQWCRLGWRDLMDRLMSDVHPPLYYLMLKPVFDLTNGNMFCARMLSAISGIILLWSGSLFLLHRFGIKSALFYACFLFLNPFMIQKTTEIRMYMLASVFTIMSGITSYYILQQSCRKHWILFTVFSLLAAYTHYYALLVMIFLYAGLVVYFLFTRNKRKLISWLICGMCTIIGYLPWLPTAWRQVTAVNREYWIAMPTSRLAPLRELFYSAVPYTEHIYPGIILLLMLAALVLFIRKRLIDNYWTLMCCSALWGILIFAIWYASHIRPILISRYLIMAMCLCVLGISSMIRYLNRYIVIAGCLFFTLIGGIRYQSALLAQSDRIATKTITFINENQDQTNTIVYVNDGYGYIAHCVEYAFPNKRHIGIEEFTVSELDKIISETNGSVWFFDDNRYINDKWLDMTDYITSDCGMYGFGSSRFEIYKLEK